eukprot:TRINITY_DN3182_c1_g1_i1.p1 TRINITY_DN3182_c1_g1~~TRINITY_DN3182_c1_g1_i1.p1  ORF type:complete len:257 (-),score=82.54 TRINITY_DN3182_c1_g1_i1:246-1016(-)
MGEEYKEEEEKKEEGKEENKAEEKKDEPEEIVLKVYMHCEGCARKVQRSLRGFQGVEDVKADSKSHKVVVKGKTADPIKVCERIQRKSGRKVEIISPLPKPPEEEKKDEKDKDDKKEEPAVITVMLKVRMHCEACAQELQRRIRKMDGIESVEADPVNDHLIVKGVFDPTKLVEKVYRRTRKQASIVKDEKEEEKKEEEKKEDKGEEEKKGEEGKGEDDKKIDVKKSEHWPTKYYMGYAETAQIFSDENPNACSVM